MKHRPFHFVVALSLLPLVPTGCSVLKPKADPTQFYVLRSQNVTFQAEASQASSAQSIRVGPWRLPNYLEDTSIVVVDGPNRLKRLDIHRWAEPLENGISRVLAENLSQLVGTPGVVLYPDQATAESGYEVQYTVSKFEGGLGQAVVLEVHWSVRDRSATTVLTEQRSQYSIPSSRNQSDADDYVDRMSEALAQWSQDIAKVIVTPR